MRRSVHSLLVAPFVCLAVTACGGSHDASNAPGGASPPAQSHVPAGTVPRLERMLLTKDEEPGFTVTKPQPETTAAAWAAEGGGPSAAYLEQLGFVAAVYEPTGNSSTGAQGTSSVVEFRTAADAATAAARELASARSATSGRSTTVTVAGVPGAVGFEKKTSDGPVANVFWVEGRCALAVGNAGTVSKQSLSTAVRSLYGRTRTSCPAS